MKLNIDSKYVSGPVDVLFFEYGNGRTCIQLADPVDGEPLAKLTVNVPEIDLVEPDEVIVKGWSENEGLPEACMKAGLIGPVIGEVEMGFVTATIHRILRRS